MTLERVFAARLLRLALTDETGVVLGRIEDVVIGPSHREVPPRVLGFVANVQRRRIFVNAGRIAEIGSTGLRLRGGSVDLRHFRPRRGELLATGLLGRRVGGEAVTDIALQPNQLGLWEVWGAALGSTHALYRRTRRVVEWRDVRFLFEGGPVDAELAALRDMEPIDVAATVHALTPSRRALVTEGLPDEQLADLLEELPEDEQVSLLENMDLARIADVVEEMEPDDAADLLGAMTAEQRNRVLAAVEPADADGLRRLLRYDATTAGGLMTPEPIVVPPEMAVAEVLARLRDPDVPPAVAAQAFVCDPPVVTPTGPYLGMVGFQRLLREPPSRAVGGCVEDRDSIRAELGERPVAERLAAYNLVAVAVVDEAGRLIGAVTVDDVLDRVLPPGWRRRYR